MRLVAVKERRKHTPYYKEWAYIISPKHGHLYVEDSEPEKGKVYIDIMSGSCIRRTDASLTLIQDPITHQVYVIEIDALIDLSKELEVGPQNVTIMGTATVTTQEVLNMLEKRIIYLGEELSRQTFSSQMIRRAIEINLLERVVDLFADEFQLTEIILYTAEDVQDLIEEITDEAHNLTGHLFDTMSLSEIDSPMMKIFYGRKGNNNENNKQGSW